MTPDEYYELGSQLGKIAAEIERALERAKAGGAEPEIIFATAQALKHAKAAASDARKVLARNTALNRRGDQ